ncbi:MAG: carboxylating nicotinate-nucleotide diphosphorylase [Nitrospiraceae bacterium]|jgi:nicotinate-nucleotide pyrophosphorylase (carboxylating)|nr:MAG: carboxylating nicotinate-nucleotide diphosphorylase [Nitrospiraceae bacterium]
MQIPSSVIRMLKKALEEDIGHGDITSSLIIPEESESRALYIAKGDFVLAGFPFAREVFTLLDQNTFFTTFFAEGTKVMRGDVLGEVSGKTRALLAGERVSLNILQRLSGIATLTRSFVDAVMGTGAKIIDTRKTTPCLRLMEKYAVRAGGGVNHRFGLYDGILIKDNHIEAVGSIAKAIAMAKAVHHLAKIEVEVENLNDLREAVEAGADVIMLDNMSVNDMKEAVEIVKKRVPLEASGNVSIGNVREIAETGVDLISIGALTHSVTAADISLKIVR